MFREEGKRSLIIAGPTASGKSDLAVRYVEYLRHEFGVESEIINADSIQLYGELKILTSYPSDDILREIPHHLYGILSPSEIPSVAFWLQKAEKQIHKLHSENKVAIICGGTGFYVNALLNGISSIPDIPADFRDNVFRKFQELGRDEFFRQLSTMDPELCKTLHKNNTQRILRAYEVAAYTKKPLSRWWTETAQKACCSAGDTLTILLDPTREELHKRCYTRLRKMIQMGAIDEVKDFMERYPLYSGNLRNVIGYREISAYLEGNLKTPEECVELMFIKTRQYAKRQSTFFRHQITASLTIDDVNFFKLNAVCKF